MKRWRSGVCVYLFPWPEGRLEESIEIAHQQIIMPLKSHERFGLCLDATVNRE